MSVTPLARVSPEPADPSVFPPDAEPTFPPQPEAPKRSHWCRRFIRAVLLYTAALLTVFTMSAVLFRYLPPESTMYMVMDEAEGSPIQQDVALEHVSRIYVAAVVLHEDGDIGTRAGPYSVGKFYGRAEALVGDGEVTTGSTIPMQLVKNIYLPRGEYMAIKVVRKAFEGVFTWPFNLVLSDQRQIELYLNYAQFGPNLYGICAASWYYYNAPPWAGSYERAYELAGVLPLGEDVVRAPGGGIDLESYGTWLAASYIEESRTKLPQRFAEIGDWPGVMETLGITDTAADYAGQRDEKGSCAKMPLSVAERLVTEDAWWSKEYGG